MKNLILTFSILIIVSFTNTGCQKPEKPVIQVPFSELSAEDKSLLDYYYNTQTITYSDIDRNELVFAADTLYINMLGNLYLQYRCITEGGPNYLFRINLYREVDSVLKLSISLDENDSYIVSHFVFFPRIYSSMDTTLQYGFKVKYDYYDSLTLRKSQFFNIFNLTDRNYLIPLNCYYTNEYGIVAFETDIDKLWLRKIE